MLEKTRAGSVIAFASIAALAMAGCSTGSGGDGAESTTLTVAWTTGNDQKALEAVAEGFEKLNPGVTLKATYAAQDQYQQTIKTQLTAGNAPDLFLVLPGTGGAITVGTLGEAGYLEDLSSRSWASDVPEQFMSATSLDGKQYLVPLGIANVAPIYNQTAMEAAGLTRPTTWPQVLEFCAAAEAQGKAAFAMGNQGGFSTMLLAYALSATLVDGDNPNFNAELATGKTNFPDSNWAEVFSKIKEMADSGCFQPQFDGTPTDTAQTLMTSGDAFAYMWFSNAIAAFTNANAGNVYDSWALPATDKASDTWMSAALSASMAVNSAAKNKPLALKFADYLASAEGSKIYTDISGVIPVNRGADYVVPQGAEDFVKLIDEGKTAAFPDQGWPNAQVQQDLIAGLQQYLAGSVSAEDVLKKMQTSFDSSR